MQFGVSGSSDLIEVCDVPRLLGLRVLDGVGASHATQVPGKIRFLNGAIHIFSWNHSVTAVTEKVVCVGIVYRIKTENEGLESARPQSEMGYMPVHSRLSYFT